MIGTSYEIDFLFFTFHIVFMVNKRISELALAFANEKFVLSDWRQRS